MGLSLLPNLLFEVQDVQLSFDLEGLVLLEDTLLLTVVVFIVSAKQNRSEAIVVLLRICRLADVLVQVLLLVLSRILQRRHLNRKISGKVFLR